VHTAQAFAQVNIKLLQLAEVNKIADRDLDILLQAPILKIDDYNNTKEDHVMMHKQSINNSIQTLT